jgi:hypothetical protein
LSLSSEAFYLHDLPTSLQQGDIAAGVPLILVPPAEYLVLVRSSSSRGPIDFLQPGEVMLVSEGVLNDAFENKSSSEYAVMSVQRAHALLITPTCDLEDEKGLWAVWPIRPLEGAGLDQGNLQAGKYANLYRLPDHKYFDPGFLDLTDIRPVRREQFPLKNRIGSITREAQDELFEKFHQAMGRTWGYREGERIEPLGKYETGKFRCARCNIYDVKVSERLLAPGSSAPRCENCEKIGKAEQWYPLTKHRK